ncbi:PaaI family thioesterase [Parvularcula maris]|uniref:PaaI family thioesterase n=1 Tax=Parvularcula maris TaxID=2965077 RepID=A0A9X2L986_9PROT|nr:PaaI family thioesterase [Parvularcula maris]MCQ8185367.1 PaaI family thioesterase [Parvularcula maris]
MTEQASAVTADELNAFFEQGFAGVGARPLVTLAERGRLVLSLRADAGHLRPGGYISGPTQMAMADHAAYAALFTVTGIVPMALTSNLNINFLRPCIGEAVLAEAEVLKAGRVSAVMEVSLRAEGAEKPSAHAVVTYVMPKG